MQQQAYPIGTPGQPWGETEKQLWAQQQQVKRSYSQQVVSKLQNLPGEFELVEYASLNYAAGDYPLYAIKSANWDATKSNALITGGVHGYETSGVQGALLFAQQQALEHLRNWNLLIVPCVSPWGYETINRWNPNAVDPNRSFYADSPAKESASLMALVQSVAKDWLLHIDLHETTDTDNSEFRPALAAREGIVQNNWNIPDGFYLVGDTHKPEPEFQKAIIQAVEKVTHIAPADENKQIIGAPLEQKGVINYDTKGLGLCAGLTDAAFVTTTEVYPDSPKVDAHNCNLAQVAAIRSALDFALTTTKAG